MCSDCHCCEMLQELLKKCTNSLCRCRMKCRMCCRETKSLNIFPNRASQEKYSLVKNQSFERAGCGSSGEMGSGPVLQLSNADAHGSKGVVKE